MKFKVGDKVRVRGWADMEKEFGLDSRGDIRCRQSFMQEMREYCGKVFVIKSVDFNFKIYRIDGIWWVFTDDMLEPVCDSKIVITTDGKETLARLYEDGEVKKSAKAECSPDDTFDFSLGAKLAFERLTKNTPAKIIMGRKYRVIGNTEVHHYYKIGEIITPIDIGLDGVFYESTERATRQWVSNQDVELVEEPAEPKYYNGKVVCVEKKGERFAYTVGKIYEFKGGRVKIDNGKEVPCTTRVTSLDEWNDSGWAMAKFIELKE